MPTIPEKLQKKKKKKKKKNIEKKIKMDTM